jgi:hypothetical protein
VNYYDAKFKREAMDNPTAWVIRPIGHNSYALDFIGEDHPIVAKPMFVPVPTKLVCFNTLPIEDLRELDYGMHP